MRPSLVREHSIEELDYSIGFVVELDEQLDSIVLIGHQLDSIVHYVEQLGSIVLLVVLVVDCATKRYHRSGIQDKGRGSLRPGIG